MDFDDENVEMNETGRIGVFLGAVENFITNSGYDLESITVRHGNRRFSIETTTPQYFVPDPKESEEN